MNCNENDYQCMEWINEYNEGYKVTDNFNRVARKLVPIRANKTSVLYELKVEKEHVNGKNTIHGGQIASLVDIVTANVVSLTIRDIPMVSVEIATSYLLPAPINEDITIEGNVLKIGRNMAFAEAIFRRKSDGAIIAKGKHTLCLLNHLKKNDGKVVSQ
uniref:Acyl-coenzyme A thioesterase 13 n=1 Tax=Strongyloides stercoralis TaxID=6248 RepID=A0A0K0EDX5_STRER